MFVNEIEVPELARRLGENAEDIIMVDVRESREVAQAAIPGALNIPLATLPARMFELDRAKNLIMICRSGARSAQATAFLNQQGFPGATNLRGGIIAWAQQGQALQLAQSA